MGVVFLAEQKTLGRLVALKTLPEAQAHHPEVLARFSREVQVLGRCDHPHIAKLLDHGETQGVRYYTMEYVPGADLEQVWRQLAKQDQRREPADLDAALAEACRRNRRKLEQGLSGTKASADTTPDPSQGSADASAILRDALTTLTPDREHDPDPTLAEAPEPYHRRICRMMADACEALDLLHERGVVHRDVSPANLMLNPDGRRLVVMDFGLARPGAGQADVTAPGG
ncbi:MAG: protein kinase, partial [Planctomycetota bacterium]